MSLSNENPVKLQDEKDGSSAMPLKISLFDRKQAGKAVCTIKTPHGDQGTGAYYRVVDKNGKYRFLIMTCNHVLPTTSLKEIMQTIFEFKEIQQMSSMRLSKEHIKFVWTAKLLDATVIKLSPQVASLYSSYGAQFLIVGEAELLAEIVLLQYPLKTVSFAHGDIDKIEGTDVFYRMGTAPKSSGSPIVSWDCVALAMHKSDVEVVTGDQPNTICIATSISSVVKAYLEEISEIDQQTATLNEQLNSLRNELHINAAREQRSKVAHEKEIEIFKTIIAQMKLSPTTPSVMNRPQRPPVQPTTSSGLPHGNKPSPPVQSHDNQESGAYGGQGDNVTQLPLVTRIPHQKLKRAPNEMVSVSSLYVMSDDLLFLACGADGLRALSLSSGQLSERDPSALKPVYGVTFDAATDTLLLAWVECLSRAPDSAQTGPPNRMCWVASLTRSEKEWSEVQRFQLELTPNYFITQYVGLSVTAGSRVLLGGGDVSDKLYAFDLNAEHRLLPVGTIVPDNKFSEFASTRNGSDTIVALSHYNDKSVSLQRLVELRLELLARVQLTEPSKLQFHGDRLLVAHWNKTVDKEEVSTHSITSYAATGGWLTQAKQLFDAKAGIRVATWCVAGERLLIGDTNSEDLLLYPLK